MQALDLFCGGGGVSVALDQLGYEVTGVDVDGDALATHEAAGHDAVHWDLTKPYIEPPFTYDLVWASPPCTAFSNAGRRDGHSYAAELVEAIKQEDWDWGRRKDLNSNIWLVLPAMQTILHQLPKSVAMENVPQARTVMDACLKVLQRYGYRGETGNLYSEEFGVAQTRSRYFLAASRVWHSTGPVKMPKPTHAKYTHPKNKKKAREIRDHAEAHGLRWWISMAEALGWDVGCRMVSNYGTGGDASNRGERVGGEPAPTITSKFDRNKIYRGVAALDRRQQQAATGGRTGREMVPMVPIDAPSPSLTSVGLSSAFVWRRDLAELKLNPGRTETQPNRRLYDVTDPAPTVSFGHDAANWKWDLPEEQESLRLTVAEAARLQAFPDNHPWQGAKTSILQQVGNAVPPPMAMAVAGAASGIIWQVILDVYLRNLYATPLPHR